MAKNDFLNGLLQVTGNMIQHKADAQKERVQFQALLAQQAIKQKMESEHKKQELANDPEYQMKMDFYNKYKANQAGGEPSGQAATAIAEPPVATQPVSGAPVTPPHTSSMPFGGDVNKFANSMKPRMKNGKIGLDTPSEQELHNFLAMKKQIMPQNFSDDDKAMYAGLRKSLYKIEQPESEKPLSPTMQKLKANDTKSYLDTVNTNKVKLDSINEVRDIMDKIPQGMIGRGQIALMNIQGKDPMLESIQKVKMVLTDAQLLNTAKTKGAISDSEMKLFADAAANNDFSSPRIKPVLNKLAKFMEADIKSQREAYIRNYGVDPDEVKSGSNSTATSPRSFNSEQEVMAAGLPSGTPVIINGRQAIWE